jgi:hypothetical protein
MTGIVVSYFGARKLCDQLPPDTDKRSGWQKEALTGWVFGRFMLDSGCGMFPQGVQERRILARLSSSITKR